MTSSTPSRKLYALLVAINNYSPPIPALRGCINDLKKIDSYLQQESKTFGLHVHHLIDEEATKENIVRHFALNFEQAKSDDVVLFYFSGHGTQEDADQSIWVSEEDGRLESIVCYDSYTIVNGHAKFNLLADKELRYMIHKVARNGAHIVTIFDCCHSGGNTRNGFVGAAFDDIRERRLIYRERLSQAFPARAWKDFIFSGTISVEDARKNSITEFLPEGKHIQLAACQNDESAFEVGGEGMFTKNLLEILSRSEGVVTYFDLQARIQNYLRHQFKQTPKAYAVGDDETILFLGFLNKKCESKPLYGNVNFNQVDGWIIDFGSMHGLSSASIIKIIDETTGEFHQAKVKEVYPTYTQLVFETAIAGKFDTVNSYKGFTVDYFSAPLNIHVNVQDATIQQNLLGALADPSNKDVKIVKAESEADYCIASGEGKIFISRPGLSAIPILQTADAKHPNASTIICNYIIHLSQFEFIKNLFNQNVFLFNSFPVEISFYQKRAGQREEEVQIKGEDIFPNFAKGKSGGIRIKLKNRSDRKLYCALFYLSFNFGVMVKLLKEVVVGLEPNAEVWALDGSYMSPTLEEEIVRYNYTESFSTIKLIVCTSDFKQQAVRFEMPELPGPFSPGNKGLDISTGDYQPWDIEDWTTRNINIRIKNPDYKL